MQGVWKKGVILPILAHRALSVFFEEELRSGMRRLLRGASGRLLLVAMFAPSGALAGALFPQDVLDPDAAYQEYLMPDTFSAFTVDRPGTLLVRVWLGSSKRLQFHQCRFHSERLEQNRPPRVVTTGCRRIGRSEGYSISALEQGIQKLEKEAGWRYRVGVTVGALSAVGVWRWTKGRGLVTRLATSVIGGATALTLSDVLWRVIRPHEELAWESLMRWRPEDMEEQDKQGGAVVSNYPTIAADMGEVIKALNWVLLRAAELDPVSPSNSRSLPLTQGDQKRR